MLNSKLTEKIYNVAKYDGDVIIDIKKITDEGESIELLISDLLQIIPIGQGTVTIRGAEILTPQQCELLAGQKRCFNPEGKRWSCVIFDFTR